MSDLNRRIAGALGWTDIREGSYWEEDYYDIRETTALFGVPPGSHYETLVPDWEHDLGNAHIIVASILSYRLEHQYTLGNPDQGGLTLIIEGVAWPEVRQRIDTPDDAAPYLLERWLEIQAAWHAAKGQGDPDAGE